MSTTSTSDIIDYSIKIVLIAVVNKTIIVINIYTCSCCPQQGYTIVYLVQLHVVI